MTSDEIRSMNLMKNTDYSQFFLQEIAAQLARNNEISEGISGDNRSYYQAREAEHVKNIECREAEITLLQSRLKESELNLEMSTEHFKEFGRLNTHLEAVLTEQKRLNDLLTKQQELAGTDV